jgi:CAP12/Pycsar effector protein, TIR domain
MSETHNPDPKRVFVVHGRNASARDAMFSFLRSLGLKPIEWSQAVEMTGEATPYVGTILDRAFDAAQAVVVLLTPDEITYLRSEYCDGPDDPDGRAATQARPNVLFEAGMAMGRDASRTVLVEFGRMRAFSDVFGRLTVRFDGSAQKRSDLANRLKTAGCDVDRSGMDWLSAGEFKMPPEPGGGLPLGHKVPAPTSARRPKIDLQYHSRGSGDGRLEIINRGTEEIRDLNLTFPADTGGFEVMNNDLPISRLPAGKSATLIAFHFMSGSGKSHFDVHVTGRTADGVDFTDDVFLNVRG